MKKTISILLCLLMVATSIVVLAGPITASGSPEGTYAYWESRAPLITGRQGIYNSATTLDGKIYALGGYNNTAGVYLSKCEIYDSDTDTWSEIAPLPYPRGVLEAVTLNDKIYAIGGFHGGPVNRVDVYNPKTNTWSPETPNLIARLDSAAVTLDGKIYIIGGARGGKHTMEIFDPITHTWSFGANLIRPRAFLTAQAVGGKIYAIGGIDIDGTHVIWHSVEVYDPQTNTWEEKSSMAHSRIAAPSVAIDEKIYIFGGSDEVGNYLATIEVYNTVTDTWSVLPVQMNTAKNGPGAANVNGRVFLFGGGFGPRALDENEELIYQLVGVIQDLKEDVEDLNLPDGIETSLLSKLEAILKSIENDRPSALGQLTAFINEVEAKRGSELTDDEADALIVVAQAIYDYLSNQ